MRSTVVAPWVLAARGLPSIAACAALAGALTVFSGCAQVPKESVELSETVGRDMAELHRSHVQMVDVFYDRMEEQVNRFVDDIYVPYQVQNTLADENVGAPLMDVIQAAKQPDGTGAAQKNAVAHMQAYVEILRENVEGYRKEKLAPLRAQRAELKTRIDDAYTRVRQGHAITTGYLASVVKVTEAQNELLAKLGVPDLQRDVAVQAVNLADKVESLRKSAELVEGKVDAVGALVKEFDAAVGGKSAEELNK